jgi:spermidine synthase
MQRKQHRALILERVESPFGEITIAQITRTGALVYAQGGCHQSESDGRGVSLSSYIHALFSLVQQAGAERILMIGCGGGALATMLSAIHKKLTIVDINPASSYIARRYFGVPDSIPFHVADGATWLAETDMLFDAIILDAYQGGDIPAHLADAEFFRSVAVHLSGKGVLVANVFLADDHDLTLRRIVSEVKAAFENVCVLDEPGARERNAILMAGHVRGLKLPWMTMKPRSGEEDIRADLNRLSFQTV